MNETIQVYKKYLVEIPLEFLNNNPEIKLGLILVLGGFFIIIGLILLFNILKASSLKKKPIFKISLRLPIPADKEQEEKAILDFINFFNSIHDLLTLERASLEIHRVNDYIDLFFTTTNTKNLENIKKFLTNIPRITIDELEDEILDNYSSEKLSLKKLVLKKKFNSLNLEQNQAMAQICDYLSSLKPENGDKGGIMICFRPIFKKDYEINKKIHKNNKIKLSNPSLNLELETQNSDLLDKQKGKMFFVDIWTIGTKPEISKALASNLKSLDGKNEFTSRSALRPKKALENLKKRYVDFEGFFTRFFRLFQASFINSYELALLFHPSKIKRGSYGTNKSVVIEASPEFFKENTNSTLVGSSFLKTGEKRKIFIPNQSRRRHTYALGSTGSGKSTTLINTALSVIKDKKSSLVFFDPNGMDIKNIMRRLSPQELKERVVYIDPTFSNNTLTINPFIKGFRASKIEKDALTENILDIFEANAKDGDLGTAIKKVLKFLITTGVWFPDYYFKYLVKTGLSEEEAEAKVYEKQISLADLPILLNKKAGFREFLKEIFHEGEDNIALAWQEQVDDFQSNPAVLDGVDNRLANITTDSILPILEGSKFDINKMIKNKKIILIPNTEPIFGIKGKRLLPQMIMTQMWAEAQREQNPKDIEKAVIIIDEVEEVQLPIIPSMLAQARKYGLSLVLANQYLFQLKNSFTNAILGNVANLFIFKMRNIDEVKKITPMFGGYVNDMDITGLEKFQGYLTTLNDQNAKASNIMSFETIDYKGNYAELSTDEDIQKLAKSCLQEFGEDIDELTKKRSFKMRDPETYFLN